MNPSYPAKDATFDFPIYHSLADRLGVLELVVWDKDMLRKDYLGEAPFTLDDLKKSGVAFDDPKNEVCQPIRLFGAPQRSLPIFILKLIHDLLTHSYSLELSH